MRRISPGARLGALEIVDVAECRRSRALAWTSAPPQQIGLLGRPFHQHVHFLPDHGAIAERAKCAAAAAIRPALAILNGPAIQLRVQMKAGARVLIRIREHTQPIELRGLYELAEIFEIGFGLAREIRRSCWSEWRRRGSSLESAPAASGRNHHASRASFASGRRRWSAAAACRCTSPARRARRWCRAASG